MTQSVVMACNIVPYSRNIPYYNTTSHIEVHKHCALALQLVS